MTQGYEKYVRTQPNQKGALLITALILILGIAIISTSLLARTITERRLLEMSANRICSFQLAESGIDEAITQLAKDSSYSGTGTSTATLGKGVYATQVTTPDPAGNPMVRRIVATGYTPNNQVSSYAYQARTVTAFVQLAPQSLFNHAVFAEREIDLTGNAMTNSYDSTLGPYGESNVHRNGDVGSNTTLPDSIEFEGNTHIYGDVQVGPGGDPNQIIEVSNNALITGTKTAAPSTVDLAPVSIPSGLSSSGSLTLSGNQTKNLAAGTYLFSQIKISGNAKLNILGPVTLYVAGSFDITGNGVSTSNNKPSNLAINIVGAENVKISGNGTFYGTIYAPESGKHSDSASLTTLTGNAEIFGAIIAYSFKATGNVMVHFDESLAGQGGGGKSQISVVSWQEA